LVNYDFDAELDGIRPLVAVDVAVRLPFEPSAAKLVSPDGPEEQLEVAVTDGIARVVLARVGVYAIVVFRS
jgi:hypothetical protein